MIKPHKTIKEYINSQPPVVRKTLEQIRKAIKSAAPKAEETISYRIPLYKQHGHLVAFMASKNHCSFVTISRKLVKSLMKELKPYKVSGTTIHFPYNKTIPSSLIKKIVKSRIRENQKNKKKE